MDTPSTMVRGHRARWPDEDVLRLHCNENPYGPPSGTIEAAAAELAGHCATYPDPQCTELRGRIADRMGVTPNMVSIGNGADDLIMSIALTFLRKGASAVMSENTFPGYALSCGVAGASPRTVPLQGYRISADALCAELAGDDELLFVCNPNNPTGTVLPPADVERIISESEAAGVIPVFDEAYMEFADPDHEYAVDAVRAGRRLLVLRTFSKAWGLASVRIGYLLGPSGLLDQIRETRNALPFAVNRVAQHAAITALLHEDYPAEVRRRTAEARALLYEGLEAAGVEYVESATNFVLLRPRVDSTELADELATAHGVLVRDLAGLGMPGHLRVTVGTPTQVRRFCSALAAALNSGRRCRLDAGLGSSEMIQLPTPPPVDPTTLFNGYVGANVVFALNELGVWEILLDGARPLPAIADDTEADSAKLCALLRVAALLGYVDLTDGDTAALTAEGKELATQRGFFTWLVGGNGGLLGGMAKLTTGRATLGREVGRDGKKVAEGSGLLGKTLLGPIEEEAIAGLEFDSVADLGCGEGSRLVRLCGGTQSRRGVGIEANPVACEAANKRVVEAGLADQVEIVGDEVLRQLERRTFPGIELVTCFLMLHDLFAETGDPERVVRTLLAGFPDARYFLVADTAAQDWRWQTEGIPSFSLGFELVHAFMGVPIVSEDVYAEAFARAGLCVERRVPFGSTSTWLYLLRRGG